MQFILRKRTRTIVFMAIIDAVVFISDGRNQISIRFNRLFD